MLGNAVSDDIGPKLLPIPESGPSCTGGGNPMEATSFHFAL